MENYTDIYFKYFFSFASLFEKRNHFLNLISNIPKIWRSASMETKTNDIEVEIWFIKLLFTV